MADAPFEVYANSVRWTVGAFDFTMDFGVQGPPEPNANGMTPPPIQQIVRVRVSPQVAYVLSRAMADGVSRYEREIGPIRLPRDYLKQIGLEGG